MSQEPRKLILVEGERNTTLQSGSTSWTLGEAGDIPVQGLDGLGVIAHITIHQQPQGLMVQLKSDCRAVVALNKRGLQDAAWLHDGDRLHCGYTELRVAVYMDSYRLIVTETEDFAGLIKPDQALNEDAAGSALNAGGITNASDDASAVADSPESGPSPASSPDSAGPLPRGPMPVWFYPLMALAFLLVASLLAFVLLARPVQIESEPAWDALHVESGWPGINLFGRRLMLKGDYRIRLKKSGYEDAVKAFHVSDSGDNRIRVNLKKLPGLLSVKVDGDRQLHPDLKIRIDHQPPQPVPTQPIKLDAGKHTVTLLGPRTLTQHKAITIQGKGEKQILGFVPGPSWASVSLQSDPTGATLRISRLPDSQRDTQAVGSATNGAVEAAEEAIEGGSGGQPVDTSPTPTRIELPQGQWQIETRKPGWQVDRRRIEVRAGIDLQVPLIRLQPAPITLSLSSRPSGASVRVDGGFRGVTPLKLELQADKPHRLLLSLPGYKTLKHGLSYPQGTAPQTRRLELQPEYGVVFLKVTPASATLHIDGKKHGMANQRLKLSTVSHPLEIRAAGYQSQHLRVTPSAERSKTLNITLKRAIPGTRRASVSGSTGSGRSGSRGKATKAHAAIRQTDYRNSAGQLMHKLGPASFRSGASRREAGRRANEHQRNLRISYRYFLAATEVTNAQFRRYKPGHNSGRGPAGDLNQPNQPVVNVTWNEAVGYAQWLSKHEGLTPAYRELNGGYQLIRPLTNGYRLPTEAEWIRAARPMSHGKPAKFRWGSGFPPPPNSANLADESAASSLPRIIKGYQDGHPGTAPVGSYPISPNGLYDINGNVAEWTNDYYDAWADASGREEVDPLGPVSGRHHVVRGAGWRSATISNTRLSYRDYSEKKRDDLGFRVARSQ